MEEPIAGRWREVANATSCKFAAYSSRTNRAAIEGRGTAFLFEADVADHIVADRLVPVLDD